MNSENKGAFIVVEGVDGVGKSTQLNLLKKRLANDGYDVVSIHFPNYDHESSYFVRQYLKGEYGTTDEVGPYTGSLFYALDRYEMSKHIRQSIAEGKIVICDRYTSSNMAHQGTKFEHSEERRGYFIWLDNLEFQMLNIPRPDQSIVLTAPKDAVLERLNAKTQSSAYVKKDIHESDSNHIERAIEVYDEMCQLFPKDFHRLECMRNKKILSINQIHDQLYETVQPHLPTANRAKGTVEILSPNSTAIKSDIEYVVKVDGHFVATPEGEEYLNDAVTSTTDNVYAFTEKLSPLTIAAAMARLSRRGDDMRITILDEFAAAAGKDEKLLQRVITAYGDDSVQQLVGQHVVVEDASNLLTKKLEWGRLASYLEQSTRYIYFDKKDKDGKYKYFTPTHFDKKTTKFYEDTMNAIFDGYSELVHKLTDYVQSNSDTPKDERDGAWKGATRAQACDAARPVLPVATKSTVGIYASGQALESLIMHLQSDDLPEANETGDKLLKQAREVIPTFLERADKPERGGATIAYNATTRKKVATIANNELPEQHAPETDAVTLTSFWPKNELDIVPNMLYEHSSLSLNDIKDNVSIWPISKKLSVFDAYMGERMNRRHKPGRAIETAHYSWDLVCDYGIFRDLQRHRIVDDLNWQLLTPRFGYETPQLIDAAGLNDLYEACFDASLKLYSALQAAGYELEAQYATLLGHKMRWKVTYNAREAFHLHELRTSPQGHPGYRKLVKEMHEKLCEVHPMLGTAMKFVNKGEDPELARLAAEKYTQFKLNQLQ